MTTTTDLATSAVTGAATNASTTIAGKSITADFNMFLKLLTTQMQNQDPLKPMESTEYTQQLAQFSQVEQTVQQTTTLKDILSRLTTQDLSQSAGMIGREGVFDTNVSALGATVPAQWNYGSTGVASVVTATIKNAAGHTVATTEIEPSASGGRFAWDGTLADGTKASAGQYTLSFSATDPAGNEVAVDARSMGIIDGVNTTGTATTLTVNGLAIDKAKLVGIGSGD